MSLSVREINQLYLAYFGRPADATGLEHFSKSSTVELTKAFDASAESVALYGLNPAAKIQAIYQNLFNRDPEPDGLAFWLAQVQSGAITPAGVALAVLHGAQNSDRAAVNNKLQAADIFVSALDSPSERIGYSGMDAAQHARMWWQMIDGSSASLTRIVLEMDAVVDSVVKQGPFPGWTPNVPGTTPPDTPPEHYVASRFADTIYMTPNREVFATQIGEGAWGSNSSVNRLDQLIGFQLGEDELQLTSMDGMRVVPTRMHNMTQAASDWSTIMGDLGALITAGPILPGEAALIEIQGGTAQGLYVYVNDSEPSFGTSDVFVQLVGATGVLPAGSTALTNVDFFFA